MSKDTYTLDDLEDILAEFSDKNKNKAEPYKAEPEMDEPTVVIPKLYFSASESIEAEPEAKRLIRHEAKPAQQPEKAPESPKAAKAPAPAAAEKKLQEKLGHGPGSTLAEFEALFHRDNARKDRPKNWESRQKPVKKAEPPVKKEPAPKAAPAAEKKAAPAAPAKAEAKAEKKAREFRPPLPKLDDKPAKKQAKAPAVKEELPAAPPEPVSPVAEKKEERKKFSPIHSLLSLVFACMSLLVLCWVLFNVHPASGTVSSASGSTVLKLSDKLDVYMNNVASDALGELAYIKKIYTLQESDTVAPVPNPEGFGTTKDVAVIQELIKKAAPLLEGQSVSFDPNADFVPDSEFMYYLDDTIMVIAWKEYINQRCCTMAEVKIAHGSQIRRKLAEDSYSSSVQYYASDMAKASNAVIAINGDFYAFRDLGITVYQRKLYRNNPATVDSCFFTASGDMLFSRAGELMGEGEVEKFIEDNDVVFAIAFGPVLVDNGELQYCEAYPIGEINSEYSRSCIGMTDDLHYLLMTINHTPDGRPRATINELARYIYSKGVQKAYTLDGGQTAEIVMMGGPINHVDFGAERSVSDIIYFATAIPNEEVS